MSEDIVKPITKEEVKESCKDIPDFVLKVVNHLIKQKWDGYSARITQDEIINLIIENGYVQPEDRQSIFVKSMLDFENHYRKAGWKVEYDNPAYNETYDAFFTFK